MKDKLAIFVHRASECLTDHEPHGDGLICHSWLKGLAERGHRIYAFANTAPIKEQHPLLVVKTARHKIFANSMANWEYSWLADRWLAELVRSEPIDLVWRMHPYGFGCPRPPRTLGRPLVVGPLFRDWPAEISGSKKTGRPRYGLGLAGILTPLADRGWKQTLQEASLLICATAGHAADLQQQMPNSHIATAPVIVDAPELGKDVARNAPSRDRPVRLVFAANLVPNKNADIFCTTVKRLRELGLDAHGHMLGDGPLRGALEELCGTLGIRDKLTFHGKVPHSQVWAQLKEAHFLLSCSWFEAYGRTIVEAMSVGTPPVCYGNSRGPADIVEDGVDGLLAPDQSAEEYAAAVVGAIDSGLWPALSEAALRKAESWRASLVLDRLEQCLLAAAGRMPGSVKPVQTAAFGSEW